MKIEMLTKSRVHLYECGNNNYLINFATPKGCVGTKSVQITILKEKKLQVQKS